MRKFKDKKIIGTPTYQKEVKRKISYKGTHTFFQAVFREYNSIKHPKHLFYKKIKYQQQQLVSWH